MHDKDGSNYFRVTDSFLVGIILVIIIGVNLIIHKYKKSMPDYFACDGGVYIGDQYVNKASIDCSSYLFSDRCSVAFLNVSDSHISLPFSSDYNWVTRNNYTGYWLFFVKFDKKYVITDRKSLIMFSMFEESLFTTPGIRAMVNGKRFDFF